jgi:iron complex transport system substrate-binding protein
MKKKADPTVFFPLLSSALRMLAALILCLATLACEAEKPADNAPGNRVRITDCAGRSVDIPSPVETVVDLAILDGTRTMVELGAASMLIGLNHHTKQYMYGEMGQKKEYWFAAPKAAPALKDLPDVGLYNEPNAELIGALNPDIILGYAPARDMADALEAQTGIPVVCINASGCLDFSMYRLMGRILGKTQRAEQLIAYAREKIAWIKTEISQIPEDERVKVFYWGWPRLEAPRTFAPYDPIDFAGGINVAMAADIKPYEAYDVTKEQIAVWDADVILIHGGNLHPSMTIDDVLSDPALKTVRAVKTRRVYFTKGFMIGWDPALGVCEVFYMAKLFYPDRFSKLDVEGQCNAILEKFYGVSGLYTALLKKSHLHTWN